MAAGSVVTAMRPIRIAFVVEPHPEIIAEAMALSSSLWGGCLNPIIPAFDKIPESWAAPYLLDPNPIDLVNGYLANFEPDYVLTLGNIGDRAPFHLGRRQITADAIRGRLVEQRYPLVGVGLRDITVDIGIKEFKYERRDKAQLAFPVCDPAHQLFLSAFFAIPEAIVVDEVIQQMQDPLPPVKRDQVSLTNYLEYNRAPNIVPRRIQLHQLQYLPRRPCLAVLDPQSPLDVLEYWNLRAAGRWVLPIPIQGLGEGSIRESARRFIESAYLPHPVHHGYFERAVIYASRSHRSIDEIKKFGLSLDIPPGHRNEPKWMVSDHYPRFESRGGFQRDVVQHFYCKVKESPLDADVITIDPIPPEFHITGVSIHKRFANLVRYRVQDAIEPVAEIIPPEVDAEDVLSPLTIAYETLSSRDGITFLCDQRTLRSRIDIPNARKVCLRWLETRGWHEVKLSPAGSVAYAMIQALGGVGKISNLARPELLRLLDTYAAARAAQRVPEEGETPEVAAELKEMKIPRGFTISEWQQVANRVVPVSEQALKDDPSQEGKQRAERHADTRRKELFEFMLQQGVVKLGAELGCPNCLRANWRAVNAMDYELACDFCLSRFKIDPAKLMSRSTWSYKPNGPFGIAGYGNGAYCVLMTLARLTSMGLCHTSLLMSFEARNQKGEKIEADLLLHLRDISSGEVLRTDLVLAECKSFSDRCFGIDDMERMRKLAHAFPGAVLVFACLKDALAAAEVDMIRKFEEESRRAHPLAYCPTVVLTGRELLTDKTLTDSFKGRGGPFDGPSSFQILTVYDLANATQILHLSMPTYSEERRRQETEARAKNAGDTAGNTGQ